MTENLSNISADARVLQDLDSFNPNGWVKAIAPAKVNLHLAVSDLRPDGRHAVENIMHAVVLHDLVYVRREPAAPGSGLKVEVAMLGRGDLPVPDVAVEDNIAYKAVVGFAAALGRTADETVRVRIEKNIPAQAGLGGGSSDAAATLVAIAHIWGASDQVQAIEQVAATLGSDVAFFLHGGCAHFTGAGEQFVRTLEPMKASIVLVKPDRGVSTGAAYRTFDECPVAVPESIAQSAATAQRAEDLELFNNLAPASERLDAQLAEIRTWLLGQPGVSGALLCGSGSTTFALCDDFATACTVVAEARKQGLWARATALGSVRAAVVSS